MCFPARSPDHASALYGESRGLSIWRKSGAIFNMRVPVASARFSRVRARRAPVSAPSSFAHGPDALLLRYHFVPAIAFALGERRGHRRGGRWGGRYLRRARLLRLGSRNRADVVAVVVCGQVRVGRRTRCGRSATLASAEQLHHVVRRIPAGGSGRRCRRWCGCRCRSGQRRRRGRGRQWCGTGNVGGRDLGGSARSGGIYRSQRLRPCEGCRRFGCRRRRRTGCWR